MTHRYHPDPHRSPPDPPDAILWDDCEDCDARAQSLEVAIAALDSENLARAWDLVRWPGRVYLTANDARLSRTLLPIVNLITRMGGNANQPLIALFGHGGYRPSWAARREAEADAASLLAQEPPPTDE